jgi:hypothetical protein
MSPFPILIAEATMQATIDTTAANQVLNTLLRLELTATQTYEEAMEILGQSPGAMDLKRIFDEHREAATTLGLHIRDLGGDPEHTAGPWGCWADIIEQTARTLGPRTAAEALKQGEEIGVVEYEGALHQEHLPADCKALINDNLLPHTREHIATLERIIEVL